MLPIRAARLFVFALLLALLALPALPTTAQTSQDAEFVYVPRVGIQIGHWQQAELPSELARIRGDSGTYRTGVDEWELNYAVAERIEPILAAAGVQVDLLPATIPPGYRADAFVALHCDGVDPEIAELRRGWKIATPYLASPASQLLAQSFREVYPAITGLPYDEKHGSLVGMRANYVFAWYRFEHTIAPQTPAVLIELAFSTNSQDWPLLSEQPAIIAEGVAQSILRYLEQYDPYATLDRRPPHYPLLRVREATPLYRGPSFDADQRLALTPDDRLILLSMDEDWHMVYVRGAWQIGYVPADLLTRTPDYRRNR